MDVLADGWMDAMDVPEVSPSRVESTWKIPVGRWGRAQQTSLAEWICFLVCASSAIVGMHSPRHSTYGYEGREVRCSWTCNFCTWRRQFLLRWRNFWPGLSFGLFFGLLAQKFPLQQRHFCPFCFDWKVTRTTLHLALTSVESDPMHRRTLHSNESEMPS